MRLTLKQIAQELGQWGKKPELTTAEVAPRQTNKVDLSVLSDEELAEFERLSRKVSAPNDRSGDLFLFGPDRCWRVSPKRNLTATAKRFRCSRRVREERRWSIPIVN